MSGDDARGALERLILGLADSKRILGIRYGSWILGAPSIETGIAASSMAQDEWGHARLIYAMLKELDVDPVPVERERPPGAYRSVSALDAPLDDWPAVVAANVVVDGALTVALEGFGGGGHEQAASRIPKMLEEERFHESHGRAWLRRLAGGAPEGRRRLRGACEAMLPPCLRWVGPDDGPAEALAAAGLSDAPGTLRERFLRRMEEALAPLELDPRSLDEAEAEWDEERGRARGRPDEESVLRARGERNRALFVE